MAAGRPREWDRDKVANQMIDWAQKDDSLNLNGFCASILLAPTKITDWARECPRFREAYETVKALLGERRERKLTEGKLHVKAYHLNASVYDHFVKEEMREAVKYESELKKEEAQTATEEQLKGYEGIMKMLKELQEDRKSDESSISSDK